MRPARMAVVALAAVCGASVPASPAQQLPTFAARAEAVRVDVLVTERGRPVPGLGPGDFEVRDNGILQELDYVSFEEMPLSVVLALDLSASVTGDRLRHLRAAGMALLDGLGPEDRAALLTFTHVLSLRSGLTRDLTGLRNVLAVASGAGRTSLADAAHAALMIGETDLGRPLVVLFSDGRDTASWLDPEDMLDAARRSRAVVYAAAVRGSRPGVLREIASATGGRLLEVSSTADLTRTFLEILNEFRHRYLLSYTPQGVSDSGWHEVDVRVPGRRVTVRARPGYWAGSIEK